MKDCFKYGGANIVMPEKGRMIYFNSKTTVNN